MDIGDLPDVLTQRLLHYFGTYKMGPDMASSIQITGTYGREQAGRVVAASLKDYESHYGAQRRAWESLEGQVLGSDAPDD